MSKITDKIKMSIGLRLFLSYIAVCLAGCAFLWKLPSLGSSPYVVLIGGAAAFFAAWYRSEVAEVAANAANKQAELAQRSYIAQRLAQATEQLGSTDSAVRTSGIYALGNLASNVSEEHWYIMTVICSYIRIKLQETARERLDQLTNIIDNASPCIRGYPPEMKLPPDSAEVVHELYKKIVIAEDVKAAIYVLGNRNVESDCRGETLDFSGICFVGVRLQGIRLINTKFFDSDLRYTILSNSDLTGVELASSKMNGCQLKDTKFVDANLYTANLETAWCNGTDFRGTKLAAATLCHANLEMAKNLDQSQVQSAHVDEFTKLPKGQL